MSKTFIDFIDVFFEILIIAFDSLCCNSEPIHIWNTKNNVKSISPKLDVSFN